MTQNEVGGSRTAYRASGEATPSTGFGAYAQRNLDLAARPSATPLTAAEPSVFAALQARLDELLEDARPARILNAGCGRGDRYVPVSEERVVVGIDVEPASAETDEDIDERLVGNIETYDFGERRFDAVYCWDVLEHLHDPRTAIVNLTSTLRPGGVLILGLPHASSVKGLITRFTPHWVHTWLWRRVLHPAASVEESPSPFPTVLSTAMTPRATLAFTQAQGLRVEFYAEYEAWPQKKIRMLLRVTGRWFSAVSSIVRVLSFARTTADATDLVIVLRKSG